MLLPCSQDKDASIFGGPQGSARVEPCLPLQRHHPLSSPYSPLPSGAFLFPGCARFCHRAEAHVAPPCTPTLLVISHPCIRSQLCLGLVPWCHVPFCHSPCVSLQLHIHYRCITPPAKYTTACQHSRGLLGRPGLTWCWGNGKILGEDALLTGFRRVGFAGGWESMERELREHIARYTKV